MLMNPSPTDVYHRFHKAVEALDRGESLEDAIAELHPELWRALLPGLTRAGVRSALNQLFSDLRPPESEKLIRETEEALRDLAGPPE